MSRVESPPYKVERADGPIEVRAYPSVVLATVRIHGARGAAISDGFKILAGYIFGRNDRSAKIEMTAPVMQERENSASVSHPIEVAPDIWKVRFVMPRQWSLDTLPKAKDSRVELSDAPAATYAVIRFSGFARDSALKARTDELMAFVKQHKLRTRGAPILALYNPPWTLPLFRRNEVMIEVQVRTD